MQSALFITLGLGFVGLYLFLPARIKVLLAIFVMTSCFNLTPATFAGIEVADLGMLMLMISAAHVIVFSKPVSPALQGFYLSVLKFFTVWLFACLLFGFLVYQYPPLNSLKAARQMIIGYMSIWVLIRLFRVDFGAFDFLWKALYWATFVFLILAVLQNLTGIQTLQMPTREYEGVVRSIPFFLYFSLMYIWVVVAQILGGLRPRYHQVAYLLMTIFIVATTYTRGIYFAVLTGFVILTVLLFRDKRLKINAVVFCLLISTGLVTVVATLGGMDRVFRRAVSGFYLIFSDKHWHEAPMKDLDDSYTGRLALARERFELVLQKNPLFGYSFIHEDALPLELKNQLKKMHGSVIYSPKYNLMYEQGYPYLIALHSADIGWANLVVDTGFVGVFLFLSFLVAIIVDFLRKPISIRTIPYFKQLAFFVQLLVLTILMFNGCPYTSNVQIPAFMIAGYAFCSYSQYSRKASFSNTTRFSNPQLHPFS